MSSCNCEKDYLYPEGYKEYWKGFNNERHGYIWVLKRSLIRILRMDFRGVKWATEVKQGMDVAVQVKDEN